MRIGDAGDCGTNPCTAYDTYVYTTDACLSYLQCADPTNILVTGATQGAGAMIGQALTQTVGGVVGGAATGVANASGTTPSTILLIAGLVAAGLLIFALKK